MMKKALSTLLLVMSSATLITVSAVPTAMAAPDCNDKYFTILGINPWYYKLLDSKKDCTIKSPGDTPEKQRKFFGRVILNVIDAMLRLVAILTIGFVIFGGISHFSRSFWRIINSSDWEMGGPRLYQTAELDWLFNSGRQLAVSLFWWHIVD